MAANLRNVFPRLAANDLVDCPKVHTEQLAKLTEGDIASGMQFANPCNVRSAESCVAVGFAARHMVRIAPVRVSFAARMPRPSLPNHIGHVLGMCTKEQMGWVAARRIITTMTNAHSVRDRAVDKLPCNPVRVSRPASNCDLTISTLGAAATPRPARAVVAGVHLGPKCAGAFFWGILSGHRNHPSGEPVGVSAPRRAFLLPRIIARLVKNAS